MNSSSSVFKILAIVLAVIAIVSFAMPMIDIGFVDASGFDLIEEVFDDLDDIDRWSASEFGFFFSTIFAAITFICSLCSIKKRGIATIVFAVLGIISMIVFIAEDFDYAGAGVYVYIICMILTIVFSAIGASSTPATSDAAPGISVSSSEPSISVSSSEDNQ